MVYLPRLFKTARRCIRILPVKPDQFEKLKRDNVDSLRNKLSASQIKNVEFLADKIFELEADELSYVLKELSINYEASEHIGLIGYDRDKAEALSDSILIRAK